MALSKENRDIVIKLVGEVGDEIKSKILPTAEIPNRNAYAHIWRHLKQTLGKSYKEADDEQMPRIIELIEWVRSNPTEETQIAATSLS
jgi:hypothetical protein